MRVLRFFLPWLLWLVLTILTIDNNIPSDGSANIGFPNMFVSITHNPLSGEYTYKFSIKGVLLNPLIIFFLYCLIYFIKKLSRKKV
jgi:hypothetical protein